MPEEPLVVVSFSAEIWLSAADVAAADGDVEQAVQDLIGSAGAVVMDAEIV